MIDLLVAGGGPVGLGTALLAARAGLTAVVVEPREPPIDKACGEGLMPGAVVALRDLGVLLSGRPFAGIRYLDGRHVAEARFRAGPGLGVRRTGLHASLVAAAVASGVELVRATVEEVEPRADHVAAAGLRARYLVAADGLHSSIRRRLGLAQPTGGPPRYGLRQHFALPPWSDCVEVHWSPDAEAYVTPLAADLVNVAVLFSGRGAHADWLAAFPDLRRRLAGAQPASRVRGAGPMRQRARGRVAGRVLLVGDAAGYVDAVTGEGVNVGLAAAAALVRCVRQDRPQDYERAWRRATRRHRLATGALVRAAGLPWARRRIVTVAARLPGAFAAAVNAVS